MYAKILDSEVSKLMVVSQASRKDIFFFFLAAAAADAAAFVKNIFFSFSKNLFAYKLQKPSGYVNGKRLSLPLAQDMLSMG